MVEDTEFVIPIHPELLDISCGEASNEPPGSHIPLQHVHQGFLLQANVNETRICENIKLERRQVGWTLLPNASIHRTLIRNCDDTQASQLPSHDVKSLTISNLKQNKFNLIEDIFDDSTLLLRKVTWSTRFASQEEAENWYNILQLIHRSFQPSPVRLPPPVVAPPRVRSLLELLPLPRVSASLPCGTASPRPFPTRRTVVLRGTVERKHSHRFRDRTWRKWVPVTWVAYSDGTLEEYAKSKHNHELLSAYRLSDCSIRSVPLPYQTPSVFVNPDNYLCISNHNLALELYKKLTGRVDLYRTPNKLLQIQWLAVLTNLSFSTSPRRTTPVMIKATASEPTRFPAKVSILKEKRLVDIFGVVVPLWVSVVWEYDEQYGIRRRYHTALHQAVIGKPVEPLQPLPDLSTSSFVVPWSRATKRDLPRHEAPVMPSFGSRSCKSNRRFVIKSRDNEEDIGVLTPSSDERDEWLAVLRKAKSLYSLRSCQSDTAACDAVKPAHEIKYSVSMCPVSTAADGDVKTSKSCDKAIEDRKLAESVPPPAPSGNHFREAEGDCRNFICYSMLPVGNTPYNVGDLSQFLPTIVAQN